MYQGTRFQYQHGSQTIVVLFIRVQPLNVSLGDHTVIFISNNLLPCLCLSNFVLMLQKSSYFSFCVRGSVTTPIIIYRSYISNKIKF